MHLAQPLSRLAKLVHFTTNLQHAKHWHRVSPLHQMLHSNSWKCGQLTHISESMVPPHSQMAIRNHQIDRTPAQLHCLVLEKLLLKKNKTNQKK